ncbi:MAG: [protein-PII] uridylyltransferase [Nitrospirota bacterium]
MGHLISEQLCEKTEECMRSGCGGLSLARTLTDLVDRLLSGVLEDALLCEGVAPSAPLALVAVGGYGRREMAPFSDIDIMVLAKDRNRSTTEAAQSVLYRLWDTGAAISHSFRTLEECVEDSLADIQTRTALIESRFLSGNQELFREFIRDVYPKILFKRKRDFIGDMLREIDRRHRLYGESVYLLEPNIKEGRGGLRDIHSIAWLAKTVLRFDDFNALHGLLPPQDYKHFMASFDFLLRARACLHAFSKRKNDLLSFEFHEGTARLLGFKTTKRFSAAEIMMRLYYKKAATVMETLSKVAHHCSSQLVSFFPVSFSFKKITSDFFISKNEIIVRDRTLFKDTDKIIEVFYHSSVTGKKLSSQVKEHIKGRFLFINRKTRASQKAVHHFLNILRGDRVYVTLRAMHETGILDRFIPEFGKLRHLVISEPYHRYTVDEHSLIAIRNLEALRQPEQTKLSYLADIFRKVKPDILFLALLLHDIGKGVSRRHEEAGYRMLKTILERFTIDYADRRRIEFLVKNHIILAKLAFARDVEAPETIAQLSEIVETEDNLNALYLMTYADMSAVNPLFWTDWKAYLFHELYARTLEHLKGSKGKAVGTLDVKLREFVANMPDRYLISSTDDIINADYHLFERGKKEGVAIALRERADTTVEICIAAGDMPGLFAKIAGVLSSNGLNVLRARIYTGRDGRVIDKFVISNWREVWWKGIEELLYEELRNAILLNEGAPTRLRDTVASSSDLHHYRTPGPFFRFESFIEIDNETSETHTILELFLPDRFGLLYEVANRLLAQGADITSAVINTEEGIAQDVFYLQYRGGKFESERLFAMLQSLGASELAKVALTP